MLPSTSKRLRVDFDMSDEPGLYVWQFEHTPVLNTIVASVPIFRPQKCLENCSLSLSFAAERRAPPPRLLIAPTARLPCRMFCWLLWGAAPDTAPDALPTAAQAARLPGEESFYCGMIVIILLIFFASLPVYIMSLIFTSIVSF